jgi:hypothetical protein
VVTSDNNVFISGTESTGVDGEDDLDWVVANVSKANDWASVKNGFEELATAVSELRSIERGDSEAGNPSVQVLSEDFFLGLGNWQRNEEVHVVTLSG